MNNITNGILTDEQLADFKKFTSNLTPEQFAWVSGYLAGITSKSATEKQELVVEKDQNAPLLTILVGSRTGNGDILAKKALQLSSDLGINATIKSMADYKPRDLQHEKNLLIIVSTHGEGTPPFSAKELYDFIFGKRAPQLNEMNYAVIGLGDSSYFQFCKTGKDFDQQLEKLGASRITPILACDVEFEAVAQEWLVKTIPSLALGKEAPVSENKFRMVQQVQKPIIESFRYTKKNPFSAAVLDKIQLHGKGSDRQTIHLELIAPVSGLEFQPGDSAGVLPVNSSVLIREVLQQTGLSADEKVVVGGVEKTLYEALYRDAELSKITPDVVGRYLVLAPNEKLKELSQQPDKFKEYLEGRDIVDLLQDFPASVTATQLIKLLRALQPRYYSIASSPKAYPGELHLTVAVVNYKNAGRDKQGTCSTFLSEIAEENEQVPIFIESNPAFRLPVNDATPIIMIGAGTGIAPYRAFVQHRELAESAGKSWLFFGNRNFESEFLYQTEWQNFLKTGALTKMDVAFSRDGDKKVYVQHKLLEHSQEIYQWLEEGAQVYICGDMKKMANDVQKALVEIVKKCGVKSKDEAQKYIDELQKANRLQLDVY